nr:replication factor A protein 1-like isoform X2 [Ipomoea batatas]
MMKFNHYTTIERHRRKGFPSLLFRIKPIEDLLAGKVEEKQLIDVIGRVVEFYSLKDKVIAGFPTQLVDLLIEDSNLKANCSPLRSISMVSYGHSANNSQSPMVVSTIRDLYERAEEGYYCVPETSTFVTHARLIGQNGMNWKLNTVHAMVDDHDELSRMVEEDADDQEFDERESGDEAISPSVQADLKLKGVDKAQDEVDTGAIKRCLLDQFSSSQNLKKSRPVVIKQEKN